MATAALTVSEARDRLDRARSTIRSLRETAERAGRMTTQAALTAAGGASVALLEKKMPLIMGLDSGVVIGAVITMAAVTDVAGDWSDELLSFGLGMLSVQAYNATKKALS